MSDILELLSDPTQTKTKTSPSVPVKKRERFMSRRECDMKQSIDAMTNPEVHKKKIAAGKASYKTRMKKIYTWRNLKQYKNLSDEEILVKIEEWEKRQADKTSASNITSKDGSADKAE